MSILIKVPVTAPMPMMHPKAAGVYALLRQMVLDGCGFDFLAVCGEICRPADFVSNKDGVATRSWHKTGRAFDYNQADTHIVLVSEIINNKQFFRTYLKCAKQDGTQGVMLHVRDKRGYTVNCYLFDFTKAAEGFGFKRIPAWNGFETHWNRQEFWHHQYDEGLTWDSAMQQLKGDSPAAAPRAATDDITGLNDRGDDVKKIQTRLNEMGLLPAGEIDGVFGAKTKTAVAAYQKTKGISADGLVGPQTRKLLFNL